MSKPTPGPWRVVRANPTPTTGEYMITGAKPGYLAEVRDCGSGDVQENANLIAAAPELLAEVARLTAIVESVELPDRSTPDTSRARALLTRLGVEV